MVGKYRKSPNSEKGLNTMKIYSNRSLTMLPRERAQQLEDERQSKEFVLAVIAFWEAITPKNVTIVIVCTLTSLTLLILAMGYLHVTH
jgi:hypothetical protein